MSRLVKIGRGSFATAYLEVPRGARVLLTARHPGHGKDIAAAAHAVLPENPHIPAVEPAGTDTWSMPYYETGLRRVEHPRSLAEVPLARSWAQFSLIRKCADEAIDALGSNEVGYLLNRYTMLRARARRVDPLLVEALEALSREAGMRSESYVFEFAPRNVGADVEGRLVLVDVLFDEREFKKMKKA